MGSAENFHFAINFNVSKMHKTSLFLVHDHFIMLTFVSILFILYDPCGALFMAK